MKLGVATLLMVCRVLNGRGCCWGNPKDSVWEDWGTLGKIRESQPPPLRILLSNDQGLRGS